MKKLFSFRALCSCIMALAIMMIAQGVLIGLPAYAQFNSKSSVVLQTNSKVVNKPQSQRSFHAVAPRQGLKIRSDAPFGDKLTLDPTKVKPVTHAERTSLSRRSTLESQASNIVVDKEYNAHGLDYFENEPVDWVMQRGTIVKDGNEAHFFINMIPMVDKFSELYPNGIDVEYTQEGNKIIVAPQMIASTTDDAGNKEYILLFSYSANDGKIVLTVDANGNLTTAFGESIAIGAWSTNKFDPNYETWLGAYTIIDNVKYRLPGAPPTAPEDTSFEPNELVLFAGLSYSGCRYNDNLAVMGAYAPTTFRNTTSDIATGVDWSVQLIDKDNTETTLTSNNWNFTVNTKGGDVYNNFTLTAYNESAVSNPFIWGVGHCPNNEGTSPLYEKIKVYAGRGASYFGFSDGTYATMTRQNPDGDLTFYTNWGTPDIYERSSITTIYSYQGKPSTPLYLTGVTLPLVSFNANDDFNLQIKLLKCERNAKGRITLGEVIAEGDATIENVNAEYDAGFTVVEFTELYKKDEFGMSETVDYLFIEDEFMIVIEGWDNGTFSGVLGSQNIDVSSLPSTWFTLTGEAEGSMHYYTTWRPQLFIGLLDATYGYLHTEDDTNLFFPKEGGKSSIHVDPMYYTTDEETGEQTYQLSIESVHENGKKVEKIPNWVSFEVANEDYTTARGVAEDGEEYEFFVNGIDYDLVFTAEPLPKGVENRTCKVVFFQPGAKLIVIITQNNDGNEPQATITFNTDGGSEIPSITAYPGSSITPPEAPTKEGYTFMGWEPEIPETMPENDLTVTALWQVNSYILTYIVDGNVYKTDTIAYGTEIIPEPAPMKEGYAFSGWSYIPATMPASDVVVMGAFSINSYTLTYLVDGEIYKTSDIEYGAPITPEPFPTREGHTFNGWSEIPATMPAHDVVVTGTFSINSYFLFYVLDGSIYKAYNVQYGSEIIPEEEPIKEGYTFSGWEGLPETMPAHDVTVQGSFSINMATGIMLDKEALLFNSFDAQKLNVTLTPDNLFNKTVLWSSSDTDIATVDEEGLVTPVNNGEAIITVCTTDGTGLEASCKVTVDFKATALGLDKVNLLITELKSQQLTAYITPAKARYEVAWSSSNESIVTVSETGTITPLRNGEATITVATTDGTGLTATCKVTVDIPSLFEVVATQTTLAIQSRSGEAEAQNINVTIEGTTYNLSDVEKLTGLAPGTTYHLEVNAVIDGYNWTEEMDVTMAEIAVNFDGKTSPTTLDINASYDAGDATIISAGFEGEKEEVSALSLNGLDPGQTYDFTYCINTEEGGTYTYKAQFTTEALTLEISRTKVVQVGDVVVVAGSNITEEENVQVGFEWRRYDWPDEIQTKAGAAFIYAGTIEGSIKNLNADKFWKIRPYFLSQAGNRYWGDWVTVDPSDASYFEPSVHTYNSVSIEDNTAEVKGFVMQGSDDVEQQGFMYWTASPQSSSRRNANGVPSDAKVVEANGNMMVASLKDLEYETEYSYVAFVKTSGGETFYGEKQTFTTGEMDPDGIKEIESLTPAFSKGEGVWYSLDGKKLDKPQRGINIIRYDDGTSKKVLIK